MNFKIPLFDLNFDEQEEQAVLATLRSKWISTGPKCTELEELFKDRFEVDYALSTSSCTAALHLAMLVLGIRKTDEVIVPSLTFAATVNAVRYVNATPVFADIKSHEDLTIDPVDIREKISSNTKAIIVMHYAGFPCDMNEIMKIAKDFDLKVIEDACHAPLSQYYNPSGNYSHVTKGAKLGSIGDIGTFSFFSNKNISTGEGGMLITNKKEYYEKAKLLRSQGMTTMSYERAEGHATSYDIVELGYNFRMDDIRASIGVVQMKKLYPDLRKREKIRAWYLEELIAVNSIKIPFSDYHGFVSNYIMTVVLNESNKENRDNLRNLMEQDGIQTSIHYPAVHRFSIYQSYSTYLPLTDYVSNNIISLPMYGSLTQKDVKYVCDSLKKNLNLI